MGRLAVSECTAVCKSQFQKPLIFSVTPHQWYVWAPPEIARVPEVVQGMKWHYYYFLCFKFHKSYVHGFFFFFFKPRCFKVTRQALISRRINLTAAYSPINRQSCLGENNCVFLHLIRLHWPVLHIEVPDFDGEVVTSHHVASAVTELHIWDGGDDLREERPAAWILRLLKD